MINQSHLRFCFFVYISRQFCFSLLVNPTLAALVLHNMKHISLLLIILAALCSCAPHGTDTSAATTVDVTPSARTTRLPEIMALELPAIPRLISTPEGRAGYLAMHFWDNLHFADTTRSLNVNFMEQNFVDFLSLLPAVMRTDRVVAFDNLLDSAAIYRPAYMLVIGIGDKYLMHPDSPQRNEEYYIDFITSALGDTILTPADRRPYIHYLRTTHP